MFKLRAMTVAWKAVISWSAGITLGSPKYKINSCATNGVALKNVIKILNIFEITGTS